jgi:hypothetical protein
MRMIALKMSDGTISEKPGIAVGTLFVHERPECLGDWVVTHTETTLRFPAIWPARARALKCAKALAAADCERLIREAGLGSKLAADTLMGIVREHRPSQVGNTNADDALRKSRKILKTWAVKGPNPASSPNSAGISDSKSLSEPPAPTGGAHRSGVRRHG